MITNSLALDAAATRAVADYIDQLAGPRWVVLLYRGREVSWRVLVNWNVDDDGRVTSAAAVEIPVDRETCDSFGIGAGDAPPVLLQSLHSLALPGDTVSLLGPT